MKQLNTKARVGIALLISFFITGLYFVLIYWNLPIVYDINDDVAMRNVAAGVITGEPDAHLIFVKYILGLVIAGLYRLIPGFDWYGITMIGTILMAMAMVLYRGLVSCKTLLWKTGYTVVSVLLFTCIGMQHIVTFQWTVSAAFAGAAGIYLFYTAQSEDRFQTVLEEGIAVFLLLLCLMIRDSVFLMVLPIAAICFWWKYGEVHWKPKKIVLRHLAVPVVLVAGTVLILAVEAFAYRSEEWGNFIAYNEDRSMITDYYGLKNYEANTEFYQSLDLTPEEVENLQRYSLYLVDDLYKDKMQSLAANAKEEALRPYSLTEQVMMGAKKVYEHFTNAAYGPVHIISDALIALTLILSWRNSKKQFGLTLVLCFIMALLWLYLGFKGRIVERVGYAMYLVTCLSMLAIDFRLLVVESQPNGERLRATVVVTGLCLILAVLSVQKWRAVDANSNWRSNYNREFLDVNLYMAEHPENVYFMTTFSIETYTDNFSLKRDFAFSNLLSVGGWHTFSPVENKKCEKLGIAEPKRDIVEKDNVYLISLQNVNLRYLDRYYTSVYGEAYEGRELVDELSYGERIFEVYDFSVKEE